MFSAIVLASEEASGETIESLAVESRQVSVARSFSRYPQAYELTKVLNIFSPELVFIDFSDWELAVVAAADIRQSAPHAAIIGFGSGWKPGQEIESGEAGVTELLVAPVNLKRFQRAVETAIIKAAGSITENLLAFLPAKAGSGATTVALNTAGYLADPLRKKVLFIDADLNSSVVSVLLDLKHCRSLREALDNSGQLDTSDWSRFVTKAHGFDLLLPDFPRKEPLPSWSNYHHLLGFVAKIYDHVVVDLPEVVNDATVETVRRAKQVFIVCTPELPSLALVPHRIEELTSRGIPPEKIGLVLNRWHKGEARAGDVEQMLSHRVAAVFGNDYRTVSSAYGDRTVVSRSSKLGKSFTAFARKLAGDPQEVSHGGALWFLKGFGAKAPAQPQL
jgi:pilus assembly protein CpaE